MSLSIAGVRMSVPPKDERSEYPRSSTRIITIFGLAAWLIQGFRLKNGLISAVLGAVVYSVISAIVLRAIGIADVDFTKAALLGSFA